MYEFLIFIMHSTFPTQTMLVHLLAVIMIRAEHKLQGTLVFITCTYTVPIPLAARSKAWVCGCSLAGIAGSNPAMGIDVCLL
jgi:hypothetical protein